VGGTKQSTPVENYEKVFVHGLDGLKRVATLLKKATQLKSWRRKAVETNDPFTPKDSMSVELPKAEHAPILV
jgi:hypothetical protein